MKLSKENKNYIRNAIQQKAEKKIDEYKELSKQSSENIYKFLDEALEAAKETFCSYVKKNKKVFDSCLFRRTRFSDNSIISLNDALKECSLNYGGLWWSDDKHDYSKKIEDTRDKIDHMYNWIITKLELGDVTLEDLETLLNEVSFDDNE